MTCCATQPRSVNATFDGSRPVTTTAVDCRQRSLTLTIARHSKRPARIRSWNQTLLSQPLNSEARANDAAKVGEQDGYGVACVPSLRSDPPAPDKAAKQQPRALRGKRQYEVSHLHPQEPRVGNPNAGQCTEQLAASSRKSRIPSQVRPSQWRLCFVGRAPADGTHESWTAQGLFHQVVGVSCRTVLTQTLRTVRPLIDDALNVFSVL